MIAVGQIFAEAGVANMKIVVTVSH